MTVNTDFYLLGSDTLQFGRWVPVFWRNLQPVSCSRVISLKVPWSSPEDAHSMFLRNVDTCVLQQMVSFGQDVESAHWGFLLLVLPNKWYCDTGHLSTAWIHLTFFTDFMNLKLDIGSRNHYMRIAQIFQKSRNHLKILGTNQMTWSKFHTEDSQILGAIIWNYNI